MSAVEATLVAALTAQLEERRRLLRDGARRVGWKLGIGEAERIGGPAVGHLTTATLLDSGESYGGGNVDLHADAEIALRVGADGAVDGYAGALELVDLVDKDETAEAIVARNIFHRAVAFGPFRADLPPVQASIVVNGDERASDAVAKSYDDRVARLREVLAAVGERLEPGDRIITGSVVQVPVGPGDDVVADFGELGQVQLIVSAS